MFAEIEDGNDILVTQLAGGGRLVAETGQQVLVTLGLEDLDGNHPADLRVKRPEDLSKSSTAQFPSYFITADPVIHVLSGGRRYQHQIERPQAPFWLECASSDHYSPRFCCRLLKLRSVQETEKSGTPNDRPATLHGILKPEFPVRIGDSLLVSGCLTQDKFFAGRSLSAIESILGFRAGRFSAGIAVVALTQLPTLQHFELGAYSNVATHHPLSTLGFNVDKLKVHASSTWSIAGPDRLVKVIPSLGHDRTMNPDVQYPPGRGAPQWIATAPILAKVIAIVSGYPNGRYFAVARPLRY